MPPRDSAALSSRQTPMCKRALGLNMIREKNSPRTARSGEMGVKTHIIATRIASASQPYQCGYMDKSTWRKSMTSSRKSICCKPATTIPFSVQPHTSIMLMTV